MALKRTVPFGPDDKFFTTGLLLGFCEAGAKKPIKSVSEKQDVAERRDPG